MLLSRIYLRLSSSRDISYLVLASQLKFVELLLKKFWKNIVNFAVLYCVLSFFTHVTKSAHFSLFLDMLSSHFYVKVNEEMIFLNDCFQIARCKQVWGWLTSSITSFKGYQGSQQIFIWWMDGSQRTIDPLYEEQ